MTSRLSLTQDVEQDILLSLSVDDLQRLRINRHYHTLLSKQSFWCLWVVKHLQVTNTKGIDCELVARHWDPYDPTPTNIWMALCRNNKQTLKLLVNNDQLDDDTMKWVLVKVIEDGQYRHVDELVRFLLTHYRYTQEELDSALYYAGTTLNDKIVTVLLTAGANPQMLNHNIIIKRTLKSNNQNMIDLLTQLGFIY